MFPIELGHRGHSETFGWTVDDFDQHKPTVRIELPVTSYELLDAMDRAGLDTESDLYLCYDVGEFNYLASTVENLNDLMLLNEASKKMCEMDDSQMTALAALVQAEKDGRKGDISAARLYDLTCAAGQCEVLPDVSNAAALGAYYIEHDLVPELKSVPNEIKDIVDYARVGFQIHEKIKGIFVHDPIGYTISDKGYVILNGEIKPASEELDLSISPPDYAMRVYARCFEEQTSVTIDLPMDAEKLNREIAALNAPRPEALEYYCRDCRIVALNDIVSYQIYGTRDKDCADFEQLNELARQIAELTNAEAEIYRAAIAVRKPTDTDGALEVLNEIGAYTFRPSVRSVVDYGKSEIEHLLNESDAHYVLAHLDLKGYGKDLIKYRDIHITAYGAIERKDGLSILTMGEEQARHTMTMTQHQL